MVTEIAGYYNGTSVVLEEPVDIPSGQKVMVTVLQNETPRKKNIDLSKYMGRGPKLISNKEDMDAFVIPTERAKWADEYVRNLRDNDRF